MIIQFHQRAIDFLKRILTLEAISSHLHQSVFLADTLKQLVAGEGLEPSTFVVMSQTSCRCSIPQLNLVVHRRIELLLTG